MSLKNWAAAVAAALLFAGAPRAAPLEAYGQLPTLSDIKLSPDGQKIAYVRSINAKRLIVIQALGIKAPVALLNVTGQKLRGLQWADNTHLLYTTSMTTVPVGIIAHRGEWWLAQSYDIETKSLYPLLQNGRASLAGGAPMLNAIAGNPQPRTVNGHTVVFVPGVYYPHVNGQLALFAVDLTSSLGRMISRDGETNAEDWVVDEAGNIVAESYYSDTRWELIIYLDGVAKRVVDVQAPIDKPEIDGLNEDGTAVVVDLPHGDYGVSYEQISLKDGSIAPWPHSSLNLGDPMTDERTARLIGGSRFTDKSDYVFFDPRSETAWNSAKAAFKDATDVDLISWSQDMSKIVVLVFGAPYGDTYFFIDMKTLKAFPIGFAYDGIDAVAPEKWIDYKAADGLDIHAYLTLPLNREPKNLPLIVLPHGGPHSRDAPGFDWISQALASRGYAVLQPQFRGSDGFGRDLLWAGFGQFGRKMQTDLSDGVRALAAQELIDPKRVCIVGASYGGYAALAGATLDTGVYRCAVSIAGLSDLKAQLEYMHDTADYSSERFWDRFLGVSGPDDPKLDAISPIKHVDKVSIPILLIHGHDDTVVPFSQSTDMADALKAAGKQVEFVRLDGEDHWLSRSETRLQMLEATVKFLETLNPPN
jgi:dipeptidyl aminopeptidase/acylaminoacyl peptidase